MLNFGLSEFLIIALLSLVVVGPERLPTMVRFLGRQYGKLMRASRELRRAFILEADRIEAEERAEILQQRKKEALERINAQDIQDHPNEQTTSVPQSTGAFIPFSTPQTNPFDEAEQNTEKSTAEPPAQNAEHDAGQDPPETADNAQS